LRPFIGIKNQYQENQRKDAFIPMHPKAFEHADDDGKQGND
jgi:hypothetical protein